MIISVVSPVHGQAGNTTAALLISLLLAKTQNKSVCLTHLSAQSSAFHTYLGLEGLEDKTCTPSQAVKLLREGAISSRDMADYCIRVCDNLDIFSNNSNSFSDDDMELTQRFILDNMPHDFLILDVDINTKLPLARLALEKSELVILTMTQSLNVLERNSEVFPDINKLVKNTVCLCNHYSPDIGSEKAFAVSLGIKGLNCCVLHHSPIIMKLCNTGGLQEIIPLSKSLPLPDIEADLRRFVFTVLKSFGLRGMWK